MLWNWIAYHARQKPEASAIFFANRGVSYMRFANDIAATTEALRGQFAGSARLVATDISHPYLRWVTDIALSRLGLTSTNPSAIKDCGADAIVQDTPAQTEIPTVPTSDAWLKTKIDPAVLGLRDPEMDFPVRMIASSGTTGSPKRVLISASTLQHRAFNMAPCYELDSNSRAFTNMGPGTVGGFTFPVGVWVAGGALVLADDPWFSPHVDEAVRPTVALISPGHLDKLLARAGQPSSPISKTRIMIGGGALAPVTLERARRALSPEICIVYASTETGLVAFDGRRGHSAVPQAVGPLAPRVEVQIVDDAGDPLPPAETGQVRVRSPMAVDGYQDDPETTARHFRDGWFYPGDIGRFGRNGILFITGRTDELINLGGHKVAPIVIEDIALRCPGVIDAGACATRDRAGDLAVVAVTSPEGFDRQALAASLLSDFPDYRIAVVEVSAIPRNEMGKILRADLVALVEASMQSGKAAD